MARPLYCRYDDCGKPEESVAGEQKAICPACHREALWSTEPGNWLPAPRSTVDYSFNDRRFLKSIRIGAE